MKVDNVNNTNFGIRIKPTRKIPYANNCYITEDIGFFKNRRISITKNYIDEKLTSVLYYVKDNVGNWVKSKLKYIENGKITVLKGAKNKTGGYNDV